MNIERDTTKTEKLSIKLRAYGDAVIKDMECFKNAAHINAEVRDLYALAEAIFEDAEKLESVGMDHLDAMLIAMMNLRRKNINGLIR